MRLNLAGGRVMQFHDSVGRSDETEPQSAADQRRRAGSVSLAAEEPQRPAATADGPVALLDESERFGSLDRRSPVGIHRHGEGISAHLSPVGRIALPAGRFTTGGRAQHVRHRCGRLETAGSTAFSNSCR